MMHLFILLFPNNSLINLNNSNNLHPNQILLKLLQEMQEVQDLEELADQEVLDQKDLVDLEDQEDLEDSVAWEEWVDKEVQVWIQIKCQPCSQIPLFNNKCKLCFKTQP